MQTSLETIGQLERRLNMAVPLAQIESEVGKRLARLAKSVKVAGFRPGKVPMKMVVAQYGGQVRSDVINDALESTFTDAVRAQNLRVAGNPRIEPRQDASTPDQLEFSAVFEVYPEIRIGGLSDVSIERPVAEVGPADVEHTLEVLCRQRTRYEHVHRASVKGDRVIVDFTGRIDGVEFPGGQAKDFAIVIGDAAMLPEFDTAVTGMAEGETKTFGLTFPADYHGKEVAGKHAEFTLIAKTVSEPHVPPVDAEFARAFGIASGSIDELKTEVAANLRLELKRKIEAQLRGQALSALRRKAEFAIPKALVESEAQNMAQRMAADFAQKGMKPSELALSPDLFRSGAEERVALGLVVAEVVRAEKLQAKPDQVRAAVEEAAQTFEQPDAVVRWHYEKPERLGEFEMQALERNVVDWVLARAKVEDKPTTFAELMGPAAS